MARFTMVIMMVTLTAASVAWAQGEAAPVEDLAQLRADYAQLKLEHDEAMDELAELKQLLQARMDAQATAEDAPAQTPDEQAGAEVAESQDEADEAAEQPARPRLSEDEATALLKRIAEHQERLESQVDTLIARQREIEQQVDPSKAADQPNRTAYTQSIESPYAYRYERTEERIVRNPAAQADKPVIVSPKYTMYSSGYASDAYVLPTEPRRTVAPPVYVNNNYFHHGTYYPSRYRVYRSYPHSYHRRHHYYKPSGVSVGIIGGKGFFKYSSGGFHRSGYHHR